MTQSSASSQQFLPPLGQNLRKARKKGFPDDTMAAFSTRCEIGLSTYKKMEKGDLSVCTFQYYKVAQVLNLESGFSELFQMEEEWFDE